MEYNWQQVDVNSKMDVGTEYLLAVEIPATKSLKADLNLQATIKSSLEYYGIVTTAMSDLNQSGGKAFALVQCHRDPSYQQSVYRDVTTYIATGYAGALAPLAGIVLIAAALAVIVAAISTAYVVGKAQYAWSGTPQQAAVTPSIGATVSSGLSLARIALYVAAFYIGWSLYKER